MGGPNLRSIERGSSGYSEKSTSSRQSRGVTAGGGSSSKFSDQVESSEARSTSQRIELLRREIDDLTGQKAAFKLAIGEGDSSFKSQLTQCNKDIKAKQTELKGISAPSGTSRKVASAAKAIQSDVSSESEDDKPPAKKDGGGWYPGKYLKGFFGK